MGYRKTIEYLHLFPRDNSFISRTVSWSLFNGGGYRFNYYACYVDERKLWFFTGIDDYYKAKGGITTDELLVLLNDPSERIESIWVSSDWDEI